MTRSGICSRCWRTELFSECHARWPEYVSLSSGGGGSGRRCGARITTYVRTKTLPELPAAGGHHGPARPLPGMPARRHDGRRRRQHRGTTSGRNGIGELSRSGRGDGGGGGGGACKDFGSQRSSRREDRPLQAASADRGRRIRYGVDGGTGRTGDAAGGAENHQAGHGHARGHRPL